MDKKYLKNIGIYILTAAICLGVIVYIAYSVVRSGGDNISVSPAEKVTMDERDRYTGYIMREEKVLYAESDGGVSYQYSDGERVPRDSVVARVYSGSNGDEVRSELVKYDDKISILSQSKVDEGTKFVGTETVDKEINEIYTEIMEKKSEGDIDFALQKREELNILLNRRKIIIGTVSDFDYQVSYLEAKENALIEGLGGAYTEITAGESGYFYTGIDGYETVFSADKVNDMTISDFDSMLASSPETGEENAIGKLVTGFKWYVATEIDVEEMKSYTVDREYSIMFPYNSDKIIRMNLDRMIVPENGKRCVLIFSSSENPRNFNYLRAQSIYVMRDGYTGYKVPASAIRVIDGVQGVYILSGSTVRFKKIIPLAEIDGYFIVEEQDTMSEDSLSNYLGYCDLVITSGKDLYDGKVIE